MNVLRFLTLPIISAPVTPPAGAIWHDSTSLSPRCSFENGIVAITRNIPNGSSDSNTVSNTTSQTNFTNGKTIQANAWAVGKSFLFTAYGKFSSVNLSGANITFSIIMGSTTLQSTAAVAMGGGTNNAGWVINGIINCRTTGSTGTVSTNLDWVINTSSGVKPSNGTQTFNMTTAQTLQIAVTISAAQTGNTATLENFLVFESD